MLRWVSCKLSGSTGSGQWHRSVALAPPLARHFARRGIYAALVGSLVLAISACVAIGVGTDNEAGVRVIDLKDAAVSPLGWVDNETIVGVTRTDERYTRKDGAEVQIVRVATINYRTGERRTYGKVSSEPCFTDGYISYIFADDATGELFASFGELGKENIRKVTPGELTFDRGPGGSCRPWSERPRVHPPPASERTELWFLWPPVGVLNCHGSSSILNRSTMASFHKSDDKRGVELPFSCYDVRRGLRYYAFKGAHFATENELVNPWPAGRDRRVYWLFPDGKVETIVLPYSMAIRESMVPTARGIIAFARPHKLGEEYGVYLVTTDSTKLILAGQATGVTSPDGCKVAVRHDADHEARLAGSPMRSQVTGKILEVCKSR